MFAGSSPDWGKSGVASLHHTGTFRSCTFGSVVELDLHELKCLDILEGYPNTYRRVTLSVRVALEPNIHIMDDHKLESVDVYVYIKNDMEYLRKPTPWYLAACQMMLNEMYNSAVQQKLSIKAVEDD